MSQFEEFRDFQGRKKSKSSAAQEEQVQTPREAIDAHARQLRDALAAEVLEKVKKCSPGFFEQLVVRLLVRMGYGGSMHDAGEAIGRSGDGGIDGVIREDKLGLDNIYLQAKRWTDKSVGTPEVDQFVGALSKKKASKGVMITTSSFTKDALASVKEHTSKIILIDGQALAQFMIDYDVGVATSVTIQIKRLDSDFFEEEGS